MRIGILTLFHKNYNWGGVLQGYALKTYLEKNFSDVTVDILQYFSGVNVVYNNKFHQALQYSPLEIKNKVFAMLKKNKGSNNNAYDMTVRKSLFNSFMDLYRTNPKIYNDKNLISAAKEYDILICGSDQIWNPNVARPGFFLQMVDKECKKVAYAASIARDGLSKHERNVMLPLIKKFDYVSVREKTAKNFLQKYMGDDFPVEEVLDPAMMLTKSDWETLCSHIPESTEKYALAFFFSESLEFRLSAEEYCKSHNLKLKFIPCAKGDFIASDMTGPGEPLLDVGPKEFINLFKNAECVFTDSFHGSVFSIIFNKNFCVFERDKNNKVSKNSRLYDLLEKFNLSDRLVKDVSQVQKTADKNIDYIQVGELLEKHRLSSYEFLKNALSSVKKSKTSTEKIGGQLKKSQLFECYLGYNKNEQIRKESSSGGLFFELANGIIKQGGCVYGAAFTEDFSVKHIRVDRKEDLIKLQKSKYVQSCIFGIYEEIENDIKAGRKVLFSGTPCQIDGIRNYVESKKLNTDNLYLIDFICHGVPSPAVWKSYVDYLTEKNGKIDNINFRDKSQKGWHDYHFSVEIKDTNSSKGKNHDTDPYMRTFLSDYNLRPSCYECVHKDIFYSSDITLGDAWKVEKDKPEWADDKGTSLFVVRNHKGLELLNSVQDSFVYTKANYDKWAYFNPSMVSPTNLPEGRNSFFNDFNSLSKSEFWKKYSKVPMKKRTKYILKRIVKKTGIEKLVRKII